MTLPTEAGRLFVTDAGRSARGRERRPAQRADASDELDDGDPDDLAERYRSLRKVLPRLAVVGGCCGTDERHIAAVARALTP